MRPYAVPLLVVPLLLLPAPPAHAAATCQGRTATIEASGYTVTGTEGPDVIVATGYAQIHALGGDDTICAADGSIDAGAGDDSVLITATTHGNTQTTDLGPGTNRYLSSGTMLDSVTSGDGSAPDHDTIDTGPGGDFVRATLAPGSDPTISGGSVAEGFDSLAVVAAPGDNAAWDAQLATATLSRQGVRIGTFSSWRYFSFELAATSSLSVHGTAGPDSVTVGAGSVGVDLAGGDDVLSINRLAPMPAAGRIELGAGSDTLSVDSIDQPVSVDLERGRLGSVGLGGVERTLVAAPQVDYRGSQGNDVAYVVGCRVHMKGGPGADVLRYASDDVRPSLPICSTYRFTILGQNGRDQLEGWKGRDRLIGGRGRDEANGKQDVDVCRAEVERQCER